MNPVFSTTYNLIGYLNFSLPGDFGFVDSGATVNIVGCIYNNNTAKYSTNNQSQPTTNHNQQPTTTTTSHNQQPATTNNQPQPTTQQPQ